MWLPERQPVELDSTRYHSTVLDLADDAAREDLLVGVDGWRRPLRFGWVDVHDHGERVLSRIRRRLALIRRVGPVC